MRDKMEHYGKVVKCVNSKIGVLYATTRLVAWEPTGKINELISVEKEFYVAVCLDGTKCFSEEKDLEIIAKNLDEYIYHQTMSYVMQAHD